MNRLILCEGKTDAILISYYLAKTAEWKYSHKNQNGLNIQTNKGNESINWYVNNNESLAICSAGGKDNFETFFDSYIYNPLFFSNAFQKIALISDRDERDIKTIENSIRVELNRKWCTNNYTDVFGISQTLSFLLLIIPKEHEGALETVILDSISENEYDKNIVE